MKFVDSYLYDCQKCPYTKINPRRKILWRKANKSTSFDNMDSNVHKFEGGYVLSMILPILSSGPLRKGALCGKWTWRLQYMLLYRSKFFLMPNPNMIIDMYFNLLQGKSQVATPRWSTFVSNQCELVTFEATMRIWLSNNLDVITEKGLHISILYCMKNSLLIFCWEGKQISFLYHGNRAPCTPP